MRTTFDFSPLFRSVIGFDHTSRLLDSALEQLSSNSSSYPPYNIEKLGENEYRISLAVAGFGEDDLDVTVADNTLTVKGAGRKNGEDTTYLYRGIAGRAFERRFQLADHIEVTGARLENGILEIDLVREIPESQKPRKIAIGSRGKKARRLTARAA